MGTARLAACLALARLLDHGTSGSTTGQRSSSGVSKDDVLSHENDILAYQIYPLVNVKTSYLSKNEKEGKFIL
ncbi:MAG: hypothetical protein EOP02_36560 [Proteobacteria bacterium]|nr:MAG: hypothetical protein EOP02_36560 [Pseudomonadota bacterium]